MDGIFSLYPLPWLLSRNLSIPMGWLIFLLLGVDSLGPTIDRLPPFLGFTRSYALVGLIVLGSLVCATNGLITF